MTPNTHAAVHMRNTANICAVITVRYVIEHSPSAGTQSTVSFTDENGKYQDCFTPALRSKAGRCHLFFNKKQIRFSVDR